MKYQEFFEHYTKLQEGKNKNIPDAKDYERIADIYKFEQNEDTAINKMAALIKDKAKAIKRGIADYLLCDKKGPNLDSFEKIWNWETTGINKGFFAKASSLGATKEEVFEALKIALESKEYSKYLEDIINYDNTVNHEEGKTVQRFGKEYPKKSNGVWFKSLNKNLTKAGIPFKYSNSQTGYHKNTRNYRNFGGRKWIEAVDLTLWPGEDKEVTLFLNIITDEGGGTTKYLSAGTVTNPGYDFYYDVASKNNNILGQADIFKAIKDYQQRYN